jgi:hypothetical protein
MRGHVAGAPAKTMPEESNELRPAVLVYPVTLTRARPRHGRDARAEMRPSDVVG